MRYFIVSILVLSGCMRAFGQECRMEAGVCFRIAEGVLDPEYGNNAESLSKIISFLKQIENDDTTVLTKVSFAGFASPDGTAAINLRLSAERCAALEHYVRSRIEFPDSIVTRQNGYVAWELLAELVETSDMPHKAETLHVLREVPVYTYDKYGHLIDSRKKRLMELQWGRTWHYMFDRFFHRLRNAGMVVVTVERKSAAVGSDDEYGAAGKDDTFIRQDTVMTANAAAPSASGSEESPTVADSPSAAEPTDTTAIPAAFSATAAETEASEPRPFYMSLKTNMLYDILAVPDLGVEFYLGRNWSIAADWMYGWWNTSRRHRYWRIYGGGISVRRWLGRKAEEKPLTGHHLGIYGQIFTFDFEWGGKGYIGGRPGGMLWDELNYAAGVEYGYSLPIARRLNIDFTVGAGYWGGKYYEYIPLDGHYVWQATKKRRWFGPTKAEISLVWLIGRGNYNGK